ncbi:MAG: HD domain-containing protein [Bacteroidales bacterium]|nr:HD domain-containing protein [Bacteroidales bacterium]
MEYRFKSYLDLPVFKPLMAAVEQYGHPAYVVGGYVRDRILSRPTKDIDVVVVGSGIELAEIYARKIGKGASVNVFRNFGTAMVRFHEQDVEWIVEFVGARKESYRADSRKPVVEDGSLEDDQNRRDFTINTLAISLNSKDMGTLLDPFGGFYDMEEGLIKTPLSPDKTYSDDPLRMMRAIRFATQLDFVIEKGSFESIRRNADRINIISRERINDELEKIILSKKPSVGFNLLMDSGLLKLIFPEFVALKGAEYIDGIGHKDNFHHTLQVLDNVAAKSDNLWLRWGAILHDIAKPVTKKFEQGAGWTFHAHEFVGAKMIPKLFQRMRMPVDERMKYVQKMVLLHLRPIVLSQEEVTDSAVRRLLFDAGDDIDDLMLLCEADITSKNREKVIRYMKNFELVRKKLVEVEAKDRIRNWQPPVTGELIMETFGIPPGKEVGIIKNAIREAILDGIIHNDFDEAYRLMIAEGERLGLRKC